MDVTFNNVLEGTRQYFMGLPKQAQSEGSGQPVWPICAPPPEEVAPAQSGAPAPSSRPPSAAAAPPPPTTPTTAMAAVPPRPPSEPLEPEPHIIHKATVMREAAEKRREQPEVEDEESIDTLDRSPPSHFIRKPLRTLPSPAPAPAAPCPSPARPPSAAPLPPPPTAEHQLESITQYRAPVHRVPTPTARPPEQYAQGRPPDPYSTSRPPEAYLRYHYDSGLPDGSSRSHGPPVPSPQLPVPARHSPQTYARLSSTVPQVSRLRESATQSPPTQRYVMPVAQPPPPHNDRVPPIHHPQTVTPTQRLDLHPAQAYSPLQQRREPSPYGRVNSHYERQPTVPTRKYDPQQAYPGYRPSPTTSQPVQSHRTEPHNPPSSYKHSAIDVLSSHYANRPIDRASAPAPLHAHDTARLPPRVEYSNINKSVDSRNAYHYPTPTPSTSTGRYNTNPQTPVVPNSTHQSRSAYRNVAAPTTNYDYPVPSSVQTSPARSTVKSGYPNQQPRMTVSVTTLVNQMNQTKQKQESTVATAPSGSQVSVPPLKHKRESPLDLSVKTVKHSADSSTTQDDVIDSASMENKSVPLQPRPPSTSNRQMAPVSVPFGSSHKVDFAPDFGQCRERNNHPVNIAPAPQSSHPVRYNGAYETRRPVSEPYPIESQLHTYPERSKYNNSAGRSDYVPRIDLTRQVTDQRHEIRRDDRSYIEDRKRLAGPIVSNIPDKIVRYETWTSDSRIERMTQFAREQHDLISRPVYSYSSYKQFEAYQKEQKRPVAPTAYREQPSHVNHRYPNSQYTPETVSRESSDYRGHYHDRSLSSNNRHHVIQKLPSHRDPHAHQYADSHNGIPADKRVLSILRNSLETKQTGQVEPTAAPRHVPDLIVIDDVDDSIIEITDLTNDTDPTAKNVTKTGHITPNLENHIQMPKAVDSIFKDMDQYKQENINMKSKSPENDVASRIRTKAELKVMPPSEESNIKSVIKSDTPFEKEVKLKPKSQKQHLFNQIREDLRLESVIKTEKPSEPQIPEIKSEPMNIEEIEKDAIIPIKPDNENLSLINDDTEVTSESPEEDLDWANACDNFMEQLKVGCQKKKLKRPRDAIDLENDNISEMNQNIGENEEKIEKSINKIEEGLKKDKSLNDCEHVPEIDKIMKDNEQVPKLDKSLNDYEHVPKIDKNQNDLSNEADTNVKNRGDISKPDISQTNGTANPVLGVQTLETLVIKQEPVDDDETRQEDEPLANILQELIVKDNALNTDKIEVNHKTDNSYKKINKFNNGKKVIRDSEKSKSKGKSKLKSDKSESVSTSVSIKKEPQEIEPSVIKEETESTDDDEPLIKSKLLKEKERSEQLKYQLLKDLSEKSAYVKLECCDVDVNKNTRKSLDSLPKEKEEKHSKCKAAKTSKSKVKTSTDNNKLEKSIDEETSDSDNDQEKTVASRLRVRKNTKNEDNKQSPIKTSTKSSPSKKHESSSASSSSLGLRKPGFGDGSDFHPGWEEELYRYKRSLRMPTRLIAIPRGRSGGPFSKRSGAYFSRGSTSLPDLDPAPLSPAPSSAPSAATDDLYARRPDKLALDSDLESNSSYSAPNKLQYDSEASSSTVFSLSNLKKTRSSIVDVLIQKCGKKEDSKKKGKDKEDRTPKLIPKSLNATELLPTPSLGLLKNGNKGNLSAKKEKLMEDIFYLGAFRKETVTAFRNAFIKNTDGLIGATEEFSPVVLKSRTRTESRVLKQRATIKEVFGDERPASAPPSSCREEIVLEVEQDPEVKVKEEPQEIRTIDCKPKFKPKKIIKDKLKRRSSSIRDGLRSTKSLKRNDAKGRLLRLKNRNSLIKSLTKKRMKDSLTNKHKKESSPAEEEKEKTKEDTGSQEVPPTEGNTKRRLKRLFGRRKFSSGFDYIRKKKKIIRRVENSVSNKTRRPAPKPSPESIHDILKEIKSWFINKSIGETHLHRAARLGFTDCVAYCLEKMEADPCAKDNAGFTPLHVAAAKGHVRIARLLLQYGANVSAAAQGGLRPLHEACENCHVEIVRLLLAYGADPLLGTYAGQTPEELAEGPAARLLRLHVSDVQGRAAEPWRFPHPAEIVDYEEMGCEPLSSPPPASPPPPPDSTIEIQCTDAPLPPFYTLRTLPGQPSDGLWCLLQDITNLLQIKSKDSLLKQIHCGSGSPKELLREIRTQEFLERAQCHQLLGAGEKVNVRASKVALVRVTDKLRQLLKIETVLVS